LTNNYIAEHREHREKLYREGKKSLGKKLLLFSVSSVYSVVK